MRILAQTIHDMIPGTAQSQRMNSDVSENSDKCLGAQFGPPSVPASWFHVCESQELRPQPRGFDLGGHSFVGYRTNAGRPVVLSGRCSHLGAYLRNGSVSGEHLVCPLHGWEFGPEGRCEKIPSSAVVPEFARQGCYPVEERAGQVFFFNRPTARFPLPFFDGISSAELLNSRPFELTADAPWYFVGANGFDLQHFRMAHDRTLLETPEVSQPSPFARRIVAKFAVSGDSLPDRLTRLFAGPQVTMDVTSWCGTMIFVRATFARTTSFGLFNVLPISEIKTLGRVIVWVKRSNNALGRLCFDPFNARIRRLFIRGFLHSDLPRIAGLRYQPGHLIAADQVMADYFEWLTKITGSSTLETI